MALDRQSIEKKDFPVGRRGYDPEAVDAHLSALAEEFAALKRSSRRRADTLASSASDQVRAIVEAAEKSAAEITRDAESEAREIRDEANQEAETTREQAADQAREYVSKVSESTAEMLQRVDSMESELSALVDALRTGGNRLDSDLRLLESNLSDVSEALAPRLGFEPEADPEIAAGGSGEPLAAEAPDDDLYEPPETPGETSGAVDEHGAAAGTEARTGADGTDDAEGARLIALNMALNGTPRDETARYLSENFHLADSDGLLNEVYASVEG